MDIFFVVHSQPCHFPSDNDPNLYRQWTENKKSPIQHSAVIYESKLSKTPAIAIDTGLGQLVKSSLICPVLYTQGIRCQILNSGQFCLYPLLPISLGQETHKLNSASDCLEQEKNYLQNWIIRVVENQI